MATLAETVKELERLKLQRAIWGQIVEYLSTFTDQEVTPIKQGILVKGCTTNIVPPLVIEEFSGRIEKEEIESLNEQIEAIEVTSIEREMRNDKEARVRSKTIKKTTSPKIKIGRKIRSLHKTPGRKIQSLK